MQVTIVNVVTEPLPMSAIDILKTEKEVTYPSLTFSLLTFSVQIPSCGKIPYMLYFLRHLQN